MLSRGVRRFGTAVACLFFAGMAAAAAHAERLVFQRGDSLYVAAGDGKDVRRLFAVGKPVGTAWAPSPDGRRVAWAAPVKATDRAGLGLKARPMTVYLAELSGQRRKRLFATDDLRDRQGRTVERLNVGRSPVPEGADGFDSWLLDSLAWSADGKSLYVSCSLIGNVGGHATFVVDSATGAAVIDAQGRWKSIAPVTEVDARGAHLVGVGLDRDPRTPVDTDAPPSEGRYRPLLVTNLAEGKTTSLLPPDVMADSPPPYSGAVTPDLSPDGRTIAFGTLGGGLWLVDLGGKAYRRLTEERADDMPRWSLDGKRVLFLSAGARARNGSASATGIYELPAPPARGSRRALIPDATAFFVVPD